jgi:hypothetical protein
MSLPLEKVRDAAKQLARIAEQLSARKIDATIDVGEDRYFVRIERVFRRVGRGKTVREEFDRTQVTVRERSTQGLIIVASPLEWL